MNGANHPSDDGGPASPILPHLPPPDFYDPVIEAYKKDVDRTLIRENLKLTVEERLLKFQRFMRQLAEVREAGHRARQQRADDGT